MKGYLHEEETSGIYWRSMNAHPGMLIMDSKFSFGCICLIDRPDLLSQDLGVRRGDSRPLADRCACTDDGHSHGTWASAM